MTMPGEILLNIGDYFGDALVDAVNDGTVNESRVDVGVMNLLLTTVITYQRQSRTWLLGSSQDGASSEW